MRIVLDDSPPVAAVRDGAVASLRRIAAMEPAKAVQTLTFLRGELEALERRATTVPGLV